MKSSQQTTTLHEIDASTLKEQLDRQAVILVDVREVVEYKGEHIPGARLLPLSQFDPLQIPRAADQPLVLYCQSGNRSAKAAEKLFRAGFREVSHLACGLGAWKKAGFETTVNRNAPISLMRQVQIVAGSLILLGVILGTWVASGFYLLSAFVGAGLLFAGITDTCAMAMLLAKLPYNRSA